MLSLRKAFIALSRDYIGASLLWEFHCSFFLIVIKPTEEALELDSKMMELLRRVGMDSFPFCGAISIKFIVHLKLVFCVLSIAIDMRYLAHLVISAAFSSPVATFNIVLLLYVALHCSIGLFHVWRIRKDEKEKKRRRNELLVKLSQICAVYRHPQLSSANKQRCLQIGLRKQNALYESWLYTMSVATVLVLAAAFLSTSISAATFMLFGIFILDIYLREQKKSKNVLKDVSVLIAAAATSTFLSATFLMLGISMLHVALWKWKKQKDMPSSWPYLHATLASVLSAAARSLSSCDTSYYMLLGIGMIRFIRAGWWLYQVDHVYLRYLIRILRLRLTSNLRYYFICIRIRILSFLRFDSDSVASKGLRRPECKARRLADQNRLPEEDRYHLKIRSLSHRVLDEFIRPQYMKWPSSVEELSRIVLVLLWNNFKLRFKRADATLYVRSGCSSEDAPQKQTPSDDSFEEGAKVNYTSGNGSIIEVKIVGVHHDDELKPYYTIEMPDGQEKQTVTDHLATSLDSSATPHVNTVANARQHRNIVSTRRRKVMAGARGRSVFVALPKATLLFLSILSFVQAADSSQGNSSIFVPLLPAFVAGAAFVSQKPLQEKRKAEKPKDLSAKQKDVFWYAIDQYVTSNKKKAAVVKELGDGPHHSQRTLNNWFDKAVKTTWTKHVIVELLSRHEAWSPEWHDDVESIAVSQFGPPMEEIYSYYSQHTSALPQANAISPTSTDSFPGFPNPEDDDESLEEEEVLFSDGALRKEIAKRIIFNLSREEELSKSETDLLKALQTKWAEENGASSDDPKTSRRLAACHILRPKSWKNDRKDRLDSSLGDTWTSEGGGDEEEGSEKATRRNYQDAEDLQAVLETIARFDLNRAALAISTVLRKSAALKKCVGNLIYAKDLERAELACQIVNSIKQCISHHTSSGGGTRPKESENMIKYLVLGSVFDLDDSVTTNRIKNALGTTAEQVLHATELAETLLKNYEHVPGFKRAKRQDFIMGDLDKAVFNFSKDDRYTRLDTNQKPTSQINPLTGKKEDIASRIWQLPTIGHRFTSFVESPYYEEFKKETGGRSAGITAFTKSLKEVSKFVSEPTQRSCVDDVIPNLEWAMIALKRIMSLKQVKSVLESYSDDTGGLSYTKLMETLTEARYSNMVRAVCCDEHTYTDLPKGEKGNHLKLTRPECARGDCSHCGARKKLNGILHELENIEGLPDTVDVNVWKHAPRQGTNDKGKQNSQLELTSTSMTIGSLLDHFRKCLDANIPHYHSIKWTDWAMKYDIHSLKEDECLVLTDFGATTNLKATETVNSATDGHLVCCNAVVLSNRRTVKVKKPLGDGFEEEDVVVFDVYYLHFLAETLSKGKKADHAMHKVCLDHVIKLMKPKGIKKIKYWTDNAPHQYKCRQTFIADASIVDRHEDGIEIIHRFAVVSQFKGPHDAAGKDIGRTLEKLEKAGIRSPDAISAFKNLNGKNLGESQEEHLRLVKEETFWNTFEQNRDPRLKQKGIYGMNKRAVFFVGEKQEEVDELKAQNPDLAEFMLVCDRSHPIDACDTVHNTADIHEIRSVQASKSNKMPRQYAAIVSDKICMCSHCLEDVENSQCKYRNDRNCHRVHIKATAASPEEVEQLLNSAAVILTFRKKEQDNSHKLGKIVSEERVAKTTDSTEYEWKFLVEIVDEEEEDGSPRKEYLRYDEACWSMEQYVKYSQSGSTKTASEWSRDNVHIITCIDCSNKAQTTCPNYMCANCCKGRRGCKLKSHDVCGRRAAASTDTNESPSTNEETPNYSSMSVVQLKDVLRSKGLPVSGKKAELMKRLEGAQ